MNTAASLADRYIEINRDIALLTQKHSGNEGAERTARLVLRAAALQARAHVGDAELAHVMRAFVAEIGQ